MVWCADSSYQSGFESFAVVQAEMESFAQMDGAYAQCASIDTEDELHAAVSEVLAMSFGGSWGTNGMPMTGMDTARAANP
jgi:hypothetical protein